MAQISQMTEARQSCAPITEFGADGEKFLRKNSFQKTRSLPPQSVSSVKFYPEEFRGCGFKFGVISRRGF
jgi:hypothetical protein